MNELMAQTNIFKYVRRYALAWLVFLLILTITIIAFVQLLRRAEERRELLFQERTEQMRASIDRRLHQYIQILKGAKGLFLASDSVTRYDWHKYYYALDVEQNYPGVQGLGYAIFLRPEELARHVRQVRAEGFPEYDVRPPGPRKEYTSIVYIEPFTGRNLRAFGYDMFSEPLRHSAMARARDTGMPTMSRRVTLVQETNQDVQPGFLIYLPVYKTRTEPKNIDERRKLLQGYVYSPFRMKDLMQNVFLHQYRDINFEIYDGNEISEENLLYVRDSTQVLQEKDDKELKRQLSLEISGTDWQLVFTTSPEFGSFSDRYGAYLVLVGGIIISILLFFAIWSALRTRHSNLLKQTITENATAALFVIDSRGNCTFANPAAERMTGYTYRELKQVPLIQLIHHSKTGEPLPESGCLFREAIKKGRTLRSHEDVFVRKDGTMFPVSCSARPFTDDIGSVQTLLEVRDITEEKRAQQAIVESEARFRNMADSAPVMIWMTDTEGECNYLNRQWRQFTNQHGLEGLGRDWLRAVHPDDQTLLTKSFTEAHAKREPFTMDFRARRNDGVYRWVVNTGKPRFDADGQFLGYIGTVQDITDRKEAERQIRENAAMLQRVFYNVPAIVGLMRAPDQEYVLANPLLLQLFGNREIVGKTAREAHPELKGQGFFRQLDRVVETGEAFVGREMPAFIDEANNGRLVQRYFNLVYQPLLDEENRVEAVLLFAVEVTELVHGRQQLASINEELREKNRELLRINNDLDNFVYTASHDLKAPIANLEGLTNDLQHSLKDNLEEDDFRLLEMVTMSVNKLKKTIADLAEITKVQKGTQEKAEPLQLEEVLKEVKADLKPLMEESGAKITTDFRVPQVNYAPGSMRSILYNLLSNAIKYRSPERPLQVEVASEEQEEHILLTVKDNGLGIKPNQLSKLFMMFTRLHSHVEGTGIGLYIVKRTIENNGGSIEVESELGKGTEFRVYLRK